MNADNNTAEETTQVSCCEAAYEAAQATKEAAHTGSRRAHGGRKQTRFTMVGGAHEISLMEPGYDTNSGRWIQKVAGFSFNERKRTVDKQWGCHTFYGNVRN